MPRRGRILRQVELRDVRARRPESRLPERVGGLPPHALPEDRTHTSLRTVYGALVRNPNASPSLGDEKRQHQQPATPHNAPAACTSPVSRVANTRTAVKSAASESTQRRPEPRQRQWPIRSLPGTMSDWAGNQSRGKRKHNMRRIK